MLAVVAASLIAARLLPWTEAWPADWVIPLKSWITRAFAWLANDAGLFSLQVRDLTRGLSWLLSWPLFWVEAALYRGFRSVGIPPLPWIAVMAGVAVLGHWVSGWRLALFCAASCLYVAVFGLWADTMQTLALVLVAVPIAAGLGLALGIGAVKSRRMERTTAPALDIMQATPHMAYLAPVVVLFGFGQVPALIATVIFAMPPMARCVVLGVRTVPPEVSEAGRMSGCTPRQLLWKVELPAAHQTIMLGLNQVVMLTLALAVIASLVGASGLGQKLLYSLQQLQVGKATEQGIAIVLIAVVLDRLTQAYAYRAPARSGAAEPWWARHRHVLVFLAALMTCALLARFVPSVGLPPKELTVSIGSTIDIGVRWVSKNLYEYILPVRDWIIVNALLPLRDFYLAVPWTLVLGIMALAGWRLGGVGLALKIAAMIGFILVIGNWIPAMLTVYLVTAATILCVLIGIPTGIWASRNDRVARVVMSICDTLQTFPSFIYLIPVIMLFKVGDVSNVMAILGYASVPVIRFTYLGLTRVPPVIIEAARAAGCTPMQRLWKVELPIAIPEIMVGINQTIMMALAMTAITALIGSRDLGQEIYKALPGADTGRGILAGLSIAFIGIVADRLIGAYAIRRKRELGLP